MSAKSQEFSEGDWIVHLVYGIGQIEAVEKKAIGGEARRYYRVRAEESEYWVPIDEAGNDSVRPLASPHRIRRALRILKEAPEKMASNYKIRRKRIRDTTLDGTLRSDIELMRDLFARQNARGLNPTEEESFRTLKNRFLKEWSLSLNIDIEEARKKFNDLLQQSQELPQNGVQS
jgi:RNA polymerase-interacting CarD/CdnL/TRCF family regulator